MPIAPETNKVSFYRNSVGFLTSCTDEKPISNFYMKRKQDTKIKDTWVGAIEGILYAKKYIHNFREWILAQFLDVFFTGKRADFVYDTLLFIKTGRRDVSVKTWHELILQQALNDNKNGIEYKTPKELEYNYIEVMGKFNKLDLPLSSFSEIMSLWCSQYGGYDDMICVLNTLFGDYVLASEPEEKVAKLTTKDMFTKN